jgi:predicted PurR-regulated permease PerM
MLNKDKKGQVGETITWVIATIILIVILLVFIFASIALSKLKSLNMTLKDSSENSVDWINSKTQMAYSINSNNKNKIQGWISQARDDAEGG